MPSFTLALWLGAAAIAAAGLIQGDGYVHAGVREINLGPHLQRRQYSQISLIVDTGSSELWVNPDCATSGDQDSCSQGGTFDPRKSSTLVDTGESKSLFYGSGNATVEYVVDTVTIGSATVKQQILGIALESDNINFGLIGFAPATDGQADYPYLLDTLVKEGVIKSRTFSLDLRGSDEPTGALILGGIDTSRFTGPLVKIPIIPVSQTPLRTDRYWAVLTGVGLTGPDGTTDKSAAFQVPVFLDSGTTVTRLPSRLFEAFGEELGGEYDPQNKWFVVDCSARNLSATVDFYFDGKTIQVLLKDFIVQIDATTCIAGVFPDDQEPTLGANFLRAAYVVFDQDNRNIHLAQAASCGSGPSIQSIGSGSSAVPSVTGQCTSGAALPTVGTTVTTGLDATGTRALTKTYTGPAITASLGGGPGPASTGGSLTAAPTATASSGGGGPNALSKFLSDKASTTASASPTSTSKAAGTRAGVGAGMAAVGMSFVVAYVL
ncbi:aspartic peptidase domain-containing protein [Lasiosphaeria miniovina]|uniref:Aspartic peptidase domain-containing protein n=1 Tax=Lasiosphaeria miniovina TaxID=1954250 RepID=A0AA40DX42_9PEZI|nr:aspartic peptidase domain-containing protein [Lasiosphaeria miniovina]KAK0716842.1 aspartic peptidase domain-containing protein [Lasiosphaeria miniovina]